MRSIVSVFALLGLVACSKAGVPDIDRIEMRRSGWVAEDVTVTSTGNGKYYISEPYPAGKSGTFQFTQQQFGSLLSRLEPYRAQAERYSDESAMRFVDGRCPPDTPRTTDAGAMYIRWIGPNYDAHFVMDFGCDAKRHADRNSQMHRIFEQLPLPKT